MSNTSIITRNPQEIQLLIEDIRSTIVECEFVSRWALVEGYHKVGEIIVKNNLSELTQIAKAVNKSKRTIYRCVQFYKKYPHLDRLPEGKNANWNMIITKYLPENPPEDPPDPVGELFKCPNCGFRFTKQDL